ncbi:MAG: hypothetical protein C5B47_07290 [Verrucomicrobia bacterium]|nr:MAG: hypothetical protein C5B47_07290 [Verrucomicrobiota bacterium]
MKSATMDPREIKRNRTVSRRSVLSRWLPLALVISLMAHIAFLWWTRGISWHGALTSPLGPSPPVRPFRLVKSPHTSPAENTQKSAPLGQPLALPIEKMQPNPEIGTLPSQRSATPPKINAALLQEKPGAVGSALEPTVQHLISEGIRKADQKLDSFPEQLFQPESSTQPVAELPNPKEAGGGAALASAGRRPGSMPKGFSNLDDLLSQTGPLRSDTAPILMPTDLLFDYDNAELRSRAVDSLRKLGTLIQRNPQATFNIEGHTDSFGSDQYNTDLSLRRAEAVKAWLVQVMGISPGRIETRGYGKTRLLAPASGTIEQQQINRRVEIIIHVPKQ